jgi:lipid II:glycine glycyltransferase (peptidoglycan interpeptide bridge formation enzyme)
MVQKIVTWYNIKEKRPWNMELVIVINKTGIKFEAALYYQNEGEGGFYRLIDERGYEERIPFEVAYWAPLNFFPIE